MNVQMAWCLPLEYKLHAKPAAIAVRVACHGSNLSNMSPMMVLV